MKFEWFIEKLLKRNIIYDLKVTQIIQKYFSFLLFLINGLYILGRMLQSYLNNQKKNEFEGQVFYIFSPLLILIAFINDFLNIQNNFRILTSLILLFTTLEFSIQCFLQNADQSLYIQYSFFLMQLIRQHLAIQRSNLQISLVLFLAGYMSFRVFISGIKYSNLFYMVHLCIMSLFIDQGKQDLRSNRKNLVEEDLVRGIQNKIYSCVQFDERYSRQINNSKVNQINENLIGISLIKQNNSKQAFKDIDQSNQALNVEQLLANKKEESKLPELDEQQSIFANSILQVVQTGIAMINNDFELTFCNSEMKKLFQTQDPQIILENILQMKIKEKIRPKKQRLIPMANSKILKSPIINEKNLIQQQQTGLLSPTSFQTFTLACEGGQSKKDSIVLTNLTNRSPASSQNNCLIHDVNHRNKSKSNFSGDANLQTVDYMIREFTANPSRNEKSKKKYKKQNSEGERKGKKTIIEKTVRQDLLKDNQKRQQLILQSINVNINVGEHDDTAISIMENSNLALKQQRQSYDTSYFKKINNNKQSMYDYTYLRNSGSISQNLGNYPEKQQQQLQQQQLNIQDLQLKQCIIPQKVLQMFEQDDFTLFDLIALIFEQQDRAYYNNYYSQNDLHDNNSFYQQSRNSRNNSDSQQQNTNNNLNSNNANNKNQEESKTNNQNSSNPAGCVSYYIEKNSLIINLKQVQKFEISYIQLRIGFYIFKNAGQYEWSSQSFVLIEMFDQGQLTVNLQEQDITEYKNRMLASISHELRTPLNCSISMLQILFEKFSNIQTLSNETELSDINQCIVKPALFSNLLLLNIINDILDYAQINTGNFKLVFASFSLFDIVTECAELMCFQASEKGLIFELQFDSSLPEQINSDQNRFKQVLLNLLSNSLKFTDKGSIEIIVSLIDEELIKIDVRDTGCGIPAQNLSKVVECFGNKTNSKFLNTSGAGLGLSIANNLAMGLGGNRKIEVQSKVNEGTCFSFYIVNRASHKKGCEIKLKDVFNRRLVKWESISHYCENTIGRTSSISTQNIHKQGSKLRSLKSNNYNHASNLNALTPSNIDNIEPSSMLNNATLVENTLKPNENGNITDNSSYLLNTDIQSNFITVTLKPNIHAQNSNNLNNTSKMFTTTFSLLAAPVASNIHTDYPAASPCSRQQSLHQQNFYNKAYSQQSSLQQQIQQQYSIPYQQQNSLQYPIQQQQQLQVSPYIKKQKNKRNQQIIRNAQSINENDHSFSFYDDQIEKQHQQQQQQQLPKNQKFNQQFGQNNIESCQVLEEQQTLENIVHGEQIIKASREIEFDQGFPSKEEESMKSPNILNVQDDFDEIACQTLTHDYFQDQRVSEHSSKYRKSQNSTGSTKDITKEKNYVQSQFVKTKIGQQQDSILAGINNQNSQRTIDSVTAYPKVSGATLLKQINWNCDCPKILVVDDNDFNLYAITMRLQQYGIKAEKATSGQNAIEKCKEMYFSNICCSKYKVILMDIDMPIKDGHQTTIEIIDFYKSQKVSHPIISACSAYVQESEKQKAKASGMMYYITKPIQSQQLETFLLNIFNDQG